MPDPETNQILIRAAVQARSKSYAPYSNYQVGAALLTTQGDVFTGANVENAVFSLTICAERSAVVGAVSQGKRSFKAIAVATKDGGAPCGSCRQFLAEFGLDLLVIVANEHGQIQHEFTIGQLLPNSFGSLNLENGGN